MSSRRTLQIYGPTSEDTFDKPFVVDQYPCSVIFLDTEGSSSTTAKEEEWIVQSDAMIIAYGQKW